MVTWSQLDRDQRGRGDRGHDRAIRAGLGVSEWEWKHYSYDRPADLPRAPVAAGFTPEPAEALMVAETAEFSALEVRRRQGSSCVP